MNEPHTLGGQGVRSCISWHANSLACTQMNLRTSLPARHALAATNCCKQHTKLLTSRPSRHTCCSRPQWC